MYLKDSLKRYKFIPNGKKDLPSNIEQEVTNLWTLNESKLECAEIYTGLQLLLQSPAESLILEDRIVWLREQGFNAEIHPVMEKTLSPRSHAIVSLKNNKKSIS
ncbi:uncharacterized protein LOC122503975 [Leptopilina heterotoma]|uniref:uncharacterized protein LOC122503975 n=1 Tax=Leptopilina heterotoma TaxID=63436 RepID=UPI001CA9CB51|nr:uncharacterized protein LOC122503975 [Leptopilina heterotoma]